MDFAPLFAVGLTYDEFLLRHGTEEHRRRWQGVYEAVRLSDDQRQVLAAFRRDLKVLCMAGAWCGDCVNQCPIFAHFAAVSERLHIRFLDRDAHPELASALKICGGARVPVVVFLSEDDQFCGLYGDRTLSKYRALGASLDGPACPTGIGAPPRSLLEGVTQDWLDEFERVEWMLRVSPRLRQVHGD